MKAKKKAGINLLLKGRRVVEAVDRYLSRPWPRIWIRVLSGVLLGIGTDLLLFGAAGGVVVMAACGALGAACMSLSVQARCVAACCVPSLAGRVGRAFLRAWLLALIVAGPTVHLASNGRELTRALGCSTALAYRMARTRVKLLVEPFREAILGVKVEPDETKRALGSIRNVVDPVVDEVEGPPNKAGARGLRSPGGGSDSDYASRMAARCRAELQSGSDRCRAAFARVYDRCYEAVTWVAAWLLCWPMKLDFFCDISHALGGDRCAQAGSVVPSGLLDGVQHLSSAGTAFTGGLGAAHLKYRVHNLKQLAAFRDAADAARDAGETLRLRAALMRRLASAARHLASLMALCALSSAQKYHNKYVTDLRWDNCYVTRYFRRVDARRRARRGPEAALLPLRKTELARLRKAAGGRDKQDKLMASCLVLLVEVAAVSVLVLLDRLLAELLAAVARHANIKYTQTGMHDLSLKVKGTGMISKLVRSVVKGFNIRKRVKTFTSTEPCLPKPKFLKGSLIAQIYATYAVIWMLTVFDSYSHHISRAICGYFYPKQAKKRGLFLYNEMLKMRAKLIRHMKAQIKQQARIKQMEVATGNLLMVLRIRYPGHCLWLRILPAARRRCAACGDRERWRGGGQFVECGSARCFLAYCDGCWGDLKRSCPACDPLESIQEHDEEPEVVLAGD